MRDPEAAFAVGRHAVGQPPSLREDGERLARIIPQAITIDGPYAAVGVIGPAPIGAERRSIGDHIAGVERRLPAIRLESIKAAHGEASSRSLRPNQMRPEPIGLRVIEQRAARPGCAEPFSEGQRLKRDLHGCSATPAI